MGIVKAVVAAGMFKTPDEVIPVNAQLTFVCVQSLLVSWVGLSGTEVTSVLACVSVASVQAARICFLKRHCPYAQLSG